MYAYTNVTDYVLHQIMLLPHSGAVKEVRLSVAVMINFCYVTKHAYMKAEHKIHFFDSYMHYTFAIVLSALIYFQYYRQFTECIIYCISAVVSGSVLLTRLTH